MRYFGTKSVEQIDEDAYAAERLMAIAGRFKTVSTTEQPSEAPVESEEAPEAQGKSN
jgi:hypothetical protein